MAPSQENPFSPFILYLTIAKKIILSSSTKLENAFLLGVLAVTFPGLTFSPISTKKALVTHENNSEVLECERTDHHDNPYTINEWSIWD